MAKRYHQSKKQRHHESMVAKHEPHDIHGHFEKEGYAHMSKMRKHHSPAHESHMSESDKHMHSRMHPTHHSQPEDHPSNQAHRRKMEMEKGGYLSADYSQVANMPQDVKMRPYPDRAPYVPEVLDDTIEGIDMQMHDDSPLRHFKPHKF